MIASYDTNDDDLYSRLFARDWSDRVEKPSDFGPTGVTRSGGTFTYTGWGPELDPAKYVGFKVSAKPGQRMVLTSLDGVNTRTDGMELFQATSFAWGYRVDDDNDGVFERDWSYGKTYTAADADFTSVSRRDWIFSAAIVTKGTVEFGVFGSGVDGTRRVRALNGALTLNGTIKPIGELESYRHVASYGIDVSEASAVTYDWDTDTLFAIGDEGEELVRLSKTGQRMEAMQFKQTSGNKALGDPEGLSYLGGGVVLIGEERRTTAVRITFDPAVEPSYEDLLPVSYEFGFAAGNLGLEGIAYDPVNDSVWGVREMGPIQILEIPGFTAAQAGEQPVVRQPIERKYISRTGCQQFSDIYMMAQCAYFPVTNLRRNHILMLSRGDQRVIEMTRKGEVVGELDFSSLDRETVEGLTMDKDGNIYLTSEQVSGSTGSQLHVFSPGQGPAPQAATAEQLFARQTFAPAFEAMGIEPVRLEVSEAFVAAAASARSQGRAEVIAAPEMYDLYTEAGILDLRGGRGVMIKAEGDEVELRLPLQISGTLDGGSWQDAGVEMKAALPRTMGKAFYRLTLPEE